MADHALPTTASDIDDVVAEFHDRITQVGSWFNDGQSNPNVPEFSVRWNTSTKQWQQRVAGVWVDHSTAYALPIVGGTINNTPIGGTTRSSGKFTTLDCDGAATGLTRPVGDDTNNFATTAYVCGQASDSLPYALGTTAVGVSKRYARSDHVHPKPNLGQLLDASFASLSNGDVLQRNSSSQWVNKTLAGAGIQATITGAASTITAADLTASRVMITDANGKASASSTISTTELGYLNNVTGNIQNQLDAIDSWPGTYTGSSAANLVFPVGTVLGVLVNDGGGADALNSSVAIYLHTSGVYFQIAVDGTPLTGTWRCRGSASGVSYGLYERTA